MAEHHPTPDNTTSHLSWLVIICVLILLETVNQFLLHRVSGTAFVITVLIRSFLYTAVMFMALRLDLARMTLAFLALPYVFFIPGWLNAWTAVVVGILFCYGTYRSLLTLPSTPPVSLSGKSLVGYIAILAWVCLSGAGGVGNQTLDYQMHNARLNDLIQYPWPVRYGEDKNFVYYFGYFLPAAALGKLTSFRVAESFQYFWTVIGVALAVRWVAWISGWGFSLALCLLFALFGPMDILSLVYCTLDKDISLARYLAYIIQATDRLDFGIYSHSFDTQPFFGNYLSNNFQLYWSPPQIIAGWVAAGLLTRLYLEKQFAVFFFIYALLSLWAPLVMIAMAPLVILAFATAAWKHRDDLLSIPNTLSAPAILIVFILFYLAGSSGQNPSYWITVYDMAHHWDVVLVSYLCGWGFYALAICSTLGTESRSLQAWFYALLIALFLLPIRNFGEYSDLFCRGSAPLMLLVFALLLRTIKTHHAQGRRVLAMTIALMLTAGMFSALVRNYYAIHDYGITQPVGSVIDYGNAYPNLGPDHTLFERYFRK